MKTEEELRKELVDHLNNWIFEGENNKVGSVLICLQQLLDKREGEGNDFE